MNGDMTDLSPIEAHERPISRIFSDEFAFEIPPYQRPYAWEVDQARDLLTDLLDAIDNSGTGDVYFLGSIVLIKKPGAAEAKVVDGQQRLTTLTILLSVMRDLTSDMEVMFERRAYIHQKASADKGTVDRFRLLLRERDRPFFQKYIQTNKGTDNINSLDGLEGSQQRIAENAQFFRSQLERMDEVRRNQLFAFVIQRCYLVVVAVPTQDAARRIFTVLNARGMDLTATDILKADLLERAGALREPELAKRWEAVELALGRDKFVELFGHIRMIFEREKPRSALEVGFPRFVSPFKGDADTFITDILEPIATGSELIGRMSSFQAQFGPGATKALRSLDRIDNKDWLPPILLRLWKRESNDNQAVATFILALERLAYFLFVTRADVNDRISRFASVMEEIDPSPSKSASAKPERVALDLSPQEKLDFIEALSGPLYRKSRVCRPVLQRLDEALSSGGAIYEDPTSIEHVLPQTVDVDSQWAALFPDEKIRAEWTHKLANLVFLTRRINSRASNWDFDRKKTEYFSSKDGASPFPLTQGVLQTGTWTEEHLKQRQAKLLVTLSGVWDLQAAEPLANNVVQVPSSPSVMEPPPGFEGLSDDVTFALKGPNGTDAKAVLVGSKFVVLKGSLATTTQYAANSYDAYRKRLLADGKLVLDGSHDRYVFTTDVVFPSPSAASATVLNRNDNGRASWKVVGSEQTYGEWASERAMSFVKLEDLDL